MSGRTIMCSASMEASAAPFFIGDEDDPPAPRGNFLHVGNGFFENPVMGRNHDDRHFFVDQGNRSVLQFACGIAFSVNIGDFLEFQRAFHGKREIRVAAKIKHMVHLGDFMGNFLDLAFKFQNLVGKTRRFRQVANQLVFLPLCSSVPRAFPTAIAKRGKNRELAGKGLGGGNTDFRTGKGLENRIGFARNGGFGHIDDGTNMLAVFPAIAKRGQRIGGFARLGNKQRQARPS